MSGAGNDNVVAVGTSVVAAVGAPLEGRSAVVRVDAALALGELLRALGADGDYRLVKVRCRGFLRVCCPFMRCCNRDVSYVRVSRCRPP